MASWENEKWGNLQKIMKNIMRQNEGILESLDQIGEILNYVVKMIEGIKGTMEERE